MVSYFEEEHTLQLFGNRVLRKIFESKRDKVSEQIRVLYNKELHGLCRPASVFGIVKSGSMVS